MHICKCIYINFNNRAPKYMKQNLIELKAEIDNSTMAGDFNIPLSIMDRRTRQIISKDIEQHYRTIGPKSTEYSTQQVTFFSSACVTLPTKWQATSQDMF